MAGGLETQPQLQFLLERQCTYIQGDLTGKPMAPHSGLEVLAAADIPAQLVCAA